MLEFAVLLATALSVESLTIREFLAQPKPEHSEELTGQALVDYVNQRQSFYKAEYSPIGEYYAKIAGMNKVPLEKKPRKNYVLTKDEPVNIDLPKEFDARKKWPYCSSLSNIRDQSSCGSCWAFASTSVMSDRLCIQSNGTIQARLSEIDLITCCGSCGGCAGGRTYDAFFYTKINGLVTGGAYREPNVCKPYPFYPCGRSYKDSLPYYGPCYKILRKPPCREMCQLNYDTPYEDDKYFVDDMYYLPVNETAIMVEIMTKGPVLASFMFYEDFIHYKDGVYVNSGGKLLTSHAVRVMGWGEYNGLPYWLVANSWNTDWGNSGYMRFLRGSNHCGIETNVIAATMKV